MISLGNSRGIFIQLMSLDMSSGKQGSIDRGHFIIWRGRSWDYRGRGKFMVSRTQKTDVLLG